jgi:hypothetical protein
MAAEDWLQQSDTYHGFRLRATQELIDAPLKVDETAENYDEQYAIYQKVWNVGKTLGMFIIFQPEYNPIMVNNDLTEIVKAGTTVLGTPGKLTDYGAPVSVENGTEVYVGDSFTNGTIPGILLTPELGSDGLIYVTCPSQCYVNGKLADVTGGDIRVRFGTLNSDKGRLGDSADCYVLDITGVQATISAPTTVEVSSHYTQANLTTTFTTDALGKIQRAQIFPLGHTTEANVPQDLLYEGPGTNCIDLCSYQRSGKDEYGFPLRYVDIVYQGVKTGEKVGWANYQSLHSGYTPEAYTAPAGIATIGVDADSNAPVEYFNLQGVRVENPTAGLYIQRQGSKATKVLVK